jgi:hypothetical protein
MTLLEILTLLVFRGLHGACYLIVILSLASDCVVFLPVLLASSLSISAYLVFTISYGTIILCTSYDMIQ